MEQGDDIKALQSRVAELESEREWTHRQHTRWGEERAELLAHVHELRAQMTDGTTLAARDAELQKSLDDCKKQVLDLEEARQWFLGQQASGEEERARLLAVVEQQRGYIADLEQARTWFTAQQAEAQHERENLLRVLEESREYIRELEQARTWFTAQQAEAQRERENLLHVVEESRDYIRELEKTRAWFIEQQAQWEAERANLLTVIDRLKVERLHP